MRRACLHVITWVFVGLAVYGLVAAVLTASLGRLLELLVLECVACLVLKQTLTALVRTRRSRP